LGNPGPQSIFFRVFVPGQMSPLASTTIGVSVGGDAIAAAKGALLSR
jgi:hypothetical protein